MVGSAGRDKRLGLTLTPRGVRTLTASHRRIDRGQTALHLLLMNARRDSTCFDQLRVPLQRILDSRIPICAAGQKHNLIELLFRESHPAPYLRVELGLRIEIERSVQQRARRSDLQTVGAYRRDGGFEQNRRLAQVRAPHVAAIDESEREPQIGKTFVAQHSIELAGRADEIEMQAPNTQAQREIEIIAKLSEVGSQQKLRQRRDAGQGSVGLAIKLRGLGIEIEAEAGLIDLHPFRARSRKPPEQLPVQRKDRAQHVGASDRGIRRLAQQHK